MGCRALLVIVVMLQGCITATDKVTAGFSYYRDHVPYAWNRTDVQQLYNTIQSELNKCDLDLDLSMLNNVIIKLSDDVAPRPSTGEINTVVKYRDSIYSGLSFDNTQVIAWRGKFHRTALVHEIMHYLIGDPRHEKQKYWDCVKLVNKKLEEFNL